jgi:hypothetical protein
MKVERVFPGAYRVQLEHMVGEYVWVVKRRNKWFWYIWDYEGNNLYYAWAAGDYEGPFNSMKKALCDAIKQLQNSYNYKYF